MKIFTPTFIINSEKDVSSNLLYHSSDFYSQASVLFIKSAKEFLLKFDQLQNNATFRLLVHPSLFGNKDFAPNDMAILELIENSLNITGLFNEVSIPFITRSTTILKKVEDNDSNKPFVELYGYLFFALTKAPSVDFIENIPIFKKLTSTKLILLDKAKTEESFEKNNKLEAAPKASHESEKDASNVKLTNDDEVDDVDSVIVNGDENEIAILAALSHEELQPFRKRLSIIEMKTVEIAEFKIENQIKKVKLFSQFNMGMVDAAVKTCKIIQDHKTKCIILAGVCGGRKKEVKLYDIIIPKVAHDIITGQFKDNNFIPSGYISKANEEMIEYLKPKVTSNDFLLGKMLSLVPKDDKHKREREIIQDLKIYIGDAMACGPFVLKTDNFLENEAIKQNNKILGFEMESYGFYRALEILPGTNLGLVVKCVMDYTDSKKTDISATENINKLKLQSKYLEYSEVTSSKQISKVAIEEVPPNENIKNMATYVSSICVEALLLHLYDFLEQ